MRPASTTTVFVMTLVAGGKIPAAAHAEMVHLSVSTVLAAVLLVSLIQTTFLLVCADGIKAVMAWAIRKIPWLSRACSGREYRVPGTTGRRTQYGVMALFSIAPAGGGILTSIFLKEVWKLDFRKSVLIISMSNLVGFILVYKFAERFGWEALIGIFVALSAVWYLSQWSYRHLQQYRYSHT
jgi:hypothetical protein